MLWAHSDYLHSHGTHLVLVGNKGRPTAVLQAIHPHLGNQGYQPLEIYVSMEHYVQWV